MAPEGAVAGEGLVTDLTLVRLAARVQVHVVLETAGLRERLLADLALIRLLPSVCPQVALHRLLVYKLLPANITLMVSDLEVYLQMRK